jgi:hypothetical protein
MRRRSVADLSFGTPVDRDLRGGTTNSLTSNARPWRSCALGIELTPDQDRQISQLL